MPPHDTDEGREPGFAPAIPEGAVAGIFTSRRTPHDADAYAEMAARMEELARRQPGFLGVESARGPDGLGITVSYWESEEAIAAWFRHPEHREAQRLGRERWYSHFHVRVARIARSRGGS